MEYVYSIILELYEEFYNEPVKTIDPMDTSESFNNMKEGLEKVDNGNIKEGKEVIYKEVEKHNPLSLYWLGISYRIGIFTEMDDIESMRVLVKSAMVTMASKNIIGEATYKLCLGEILFEIGTIIEEYRCRGKSYYIPLYEVASKLGSYDASIRLGDFYNKRGRNRNKKKALVYYSLAEEQSSDSTFHLESTAPVQNNSQMDPDLHKE